MPSYLTRGVFRRLLSSQPVVIHRHPVRRAVHSRPQVSSHGRIALPRTTKRMLFGFLENKSQQRDLREPTLDPGMSKMLELDKRIHMIARYPPNDQLVEAFNAFVQTKKKRRLPIEDFHATQLLQTLRVIEDDSQKLGQSLLAPRDYYNALFVLGTTPTEKLSSVHTELAWLLYKRWASATSVARKAASGEQEQESSSTKADFLTRMVNLLCRTGQTRQAKELLEELSASKSLGEDDMNASTLVRRLWPRLVDGFVREDNEPEMLEALAKFESEGRPLSNNLSASLALYYARKNNVGKTKSLFASKSLSLAGHTPSLTWYSQAEVRKELFAFCLRNNEMHWAQTILQNENGELDQEAMLLGAAAAGKSIDELNHILIALAQRSDNPQQWTPGVNTINALLDFAVSKGDPYLAERIFVLAQSWNTPVNAETYIQQIRYRLLANDPKGALASYDLLRQQPINHDEDWDVMNQLTQVVAAMSDASHDTLMGLAADLSDRERLFPAETVAALCAYHVRRDEYFELVDLLQTYAYQYSTADRIMLRDLLLAVCLNPESDTARIWDTYMIFHQVFDLETARGPRQSVMETLFARKRPDLGTHVFTRTARHSRANTRPDHDMYVAALVGIADTSEAEALEVVHNMLKLDTDVEPSTKLRTALMIAYVACGAHWRALEFWDEVATSPEGPSYNSLHAAFAACEQSSFGYETAHAIWRRLMKSEVEVGVALMASYVSALAGNGLIKSCGEVIDGMEAVIGQKRDADVEVCVGAMFNSIRGVVQQEECEEWALERYAAVWGRLMERGVETNVMGVRKIAGMERRLVP